MVLTEKEENVLRLMIAKTLAKNKLNKARIQSQKDSLLVATPLENEVTATTNLLNDVVE